MAKNQPVIIKGKTSIARYWVKATNSPGESVPSMTRNPPSQSTAIVPKAGISSNNGAYSARCLATAMVLS